MKKTFQYLLFLGIGGGLIWYSIASGIINPTKLWEDVSSANLWWVGLMVVLIVVLSGCGSPAPSVAESADELTLVTRQADLVEPGLWLKAVAATGDR